MYVWYIHTYLLYYIWNCRPEIVSFLHWLSVFLSACPKMHKSMLWKRQWLRAMPFPMQTNRGYLCVCVSVRVWHNEVSALVQKLSTWKLHVLQISKKAQAKAHTRTRTHAVLCCVCLWLQLSQLLPFICAYQRVKCAIQMQMRSVIKNVQMPA